jgi:hypothetical protein
MAGNFEIKVTLLNLNKYVHWVVTDAYLRVLSIEIFWVVMLCGLVAGNRNFRGIFWPPD